MKIIIGSDHAGFELKSNLIGFLQEMGHEVVDVGPQVYDANDDYPYFIDQVAKAIQQDQSSKGIVIGGSGQGEAISANRFKGVRAALYYGGDMSIVTLSRQHNDANILSLGARFVGLDETKEAVSVWLATSFSGDERHKRRIEEIDTLS